MKLFFLTIFLTLCVCIPISGSNPWRPSGARQSGLGGASVGVVDLWAPANNQAAMAFYQLPAVGAYFNNAYFLKELSTKSLVGMMPVGKGAFGVVFNHFGYHYYNEINAGLSYARRFGNYFSAAVQLDFLHLGQGNGELGNKSTATFEVSLMGKVTKTLTLGAHVYNPIGVKYSKDVKIPACYRLGLGWVPVKNVLAVAEAEMMSGERVNIKCGVEYAPVKLLAIRVGYASLPQLWDFGVGLNFSGFSLDLTPTWNNMLGWSTHIALSYHFSKKEK